MHDVQDVQDVQMYRCTHAWLGGVTHENVCDEKLGGQQKQNSMDANLWGISRGWL